MLNKTLQPHELKRIEETIEELKTKVYNAVCVDCTSIYADYPRVISSDSIWYHVDVLNHDVRMINF